MTQQKLQCSVAKIPCFCFLFYTVEEISYDAFEKL